MKGYTHTHTHTHTLTWKAEKKYFVPRTKYAGNGYGKYPFLSLVGKKHKLIKDGENTYREQP